MIPNIPSMKPGREVAQDQRAGISKPMSNHFCSAKTFVFDVDATIRLFRSPQILAMDSRFKKPAQNRHKKRRLTGQQDSFSSAQFIHIYYKFRIHNCIQ